MSRICALVTNACAPAKLGMPVGQRRVALRPCVTRSTISAYDGFVLSRFGPSRPVLLAAFSTWHDAQKSPAREKSALPRAGFPCTVVPSEIARALAVTSAAAAIAASRSVVFEVIGRAYSGGEAEPRDLEPPVRLLVGFPRVAYTR